MEGPHLGITPDFLAESITRELLQASGAPANSTWEQMESIEKKLICTCQKPHFEKSVNIAVLASLFVGGRFLTRFSQVEHIWHEYTWDSLFDAERGGGGKKVKRIKCAWVFLAILRPRGTNCFVWVVKRLAHLPCRLRDPTFRQSPSGRTVHR